MYEVMARRYRPATFDEVIGQEHLARTLKNAISSERVAHAYLFCGPHGCGKTSMARIFAKALVCEIGPTPTPCGKCSLCQDVLKGHDVDVQEIDGASNNSVEQVRTLREQASYIPTRARFKIYIIDEVHMLSGSAFNALLKILEEPPAHVKFILATTDPHKLPDTILSRCQRFDFRLVPAPVLGTFLKELVAKEAADITDEALAAIASFSGGSVRDGLVLLDQLLSYSDGRVEREDVEQVRGVAGAESVAGLFRAITSHNLQEALAIVDEVAQRGTSVGDFLDQLIEFGRDLMLVVTTGKFDLVSAYGPARATLEELHQTTALDQALLVLDVLVDARTRVRSRALSNPLVPLEMAVARLAGLDSIEPVSTVIKRLSALASGAPLPAPATQPPPETVRTRQTVQKVVRQIAPSSPEPEAPADAPAASIETVTGERAKDAWDRILEYIRQTSPQDCVYLDGVGVDRVQNDIIVLSVPGGGSFLFEQLEDPRRKLRLSKACSEVLGVSLEVRLELSSPIGGHDNEKAVQKEKIAIRDARNDPAVEMLTDRFHGKLINIEQSGSK